MSILVDMMRCCRESLSVCVPCAMRTSCHEHIGPSVFVWYASLFCMRMVLYECLSVWICFTMSTHWHACFWYNYNLAWVLLDMSLFWREELLAWGIFCYEYLLVWLFPGTNTTCYVYLLVWISFGMSSFWCEYMLVWIYFVTSIFLARVFPPWVPVGMSISCQFFDMANLAMHMFCYKHVLLWVSVEQSTKRLQTLIVCTERFRLTPRPTPSSRIKSNQPSTKIPATPHWQSQIPLRHSQTPHRRFTRNKHPQMSCTLHLRHSQNPYRNSIRKHFPTPLM